MEIKKGRLPAQEAAFFYERLPESAASLAALRSRQPVLPKEHSHMTSQAH